MKTEYRLVVEQWGTERYYGKRDLVHAETGLEHSIRDLKVQESVYPDSPDSKTWIERREVGEWDAITLDKAVSL